MKYIALALFLVSGPSVLAASSFDGRQWNISTGNLSVGYIRTAPMGAAPTPGVTGPPPSVESLAEMKRNGLVAYDDYCAWGAEEREPGKWDWTQHDRMYEAVKKAGLDYVVLSWVHFPPVWLRESGRDKRTLMRCVEHAKDTNYLSIFDPKTIEHYDHYYRALHDHFGDKLDGVWACILGPYSEGNYPLYVPDWVDMGHCHEGYWCADPYALAAYRDAMRRKYGGISALNAAWGTAHRSFSDVRPPSAIKEGFKANPELMKTAAERRQWLDFITWYHQAIIDFAEKSIRVVLKYWPKEKVRVGPGGSYGGMNPIPWGTYCPGYARMAAPYGVYLEPADYFGAIYGDKWVGTAYRFYGVPHSTQPAGSLDKPTFVRRLFSDASCGVSQIFTYEFNDHIPEIQRYIHHLTGRAGDTDVAVLCPTTLYRLGGDVWPTIRASVKMRDLTDFDVLDELLVLDGALGPKYHFAVMFQGDYVEQSVLDRVESWVRNGGTLIVCQPERVKNVDGGPWGFPSGSSLGKGRIVRMDTAPEAPATLDSLRSQFARRGSLDAEFDGVLLTRRGREILLLNDTDKPVTKTVRAGSRSLRVDLEPHSIGVASL